MALVAPKNQINKTLSNDELKELYGLYKQVKLKMNRNTVN